MNDVMFNKMFMFILFRLRIRNKRENSATANASSCVKMRRVPGMREGAGEMRHGGNYHLACCRLSFLSGKVSFRSKLGLYYVLHSCHVKFQ